MSITPEADGQTPSGALTARRAWISLAVAALAMVGSVGIVVAQVTVTSDVESVTRTCGSAFDAVTDRSGWEVWWSRDLDEADESIRSALIRTDLCPAAVNRRIVLTTLLGALGVVAVLSTRFRLRSGREVVGVDRPRPGGLGRLGRSVSWVAAMLLIGGVVAIIVLVADADSTLFLYVDRLVVGMVGLIVLLPAIALFAIGRALVVVGAELERRSHDEDSDDA